MDLYRYIYVAFRWGYGVQRWLLQHLTPLGCGVLGMALISGVIGLGSSQSLCHLLFFLSLSLLLLASLARRFVQISFNIDRLLPRFGTVGESLGYGITLKNLTAHVQPGLQFTESIPNEYPTLSEFLQIRAQYSMGWQWFKMVQQTVEKRQWAIAPLTEIPTIGARGKSEVTCDILPLKRGRLCLSTPTLMATDPLGLLYRRVNYTHEQSVCILPQRYELPPMFSANHRAYQMGDAVLTSSVGESLEFRALRDYRPGDPTNKIHWKSWAKVGKPIVKEQQDESAVHHGLILDTFYPEAYSELFEEMLAIATSILMQSQGDSALLDVIFAAEALRCVTAGPGARKKELLLELMATINPCQSLLFQDLIPLAQSRLPRLSSCVCLLIQWDQTRQSFLENIAQCNLPMKVIVLCEGQQSHQGLRYIALSQSCTVYFISIDQIQPSLLQL